MKTEKLIPIKKVALKNNCPECFSKNGLQLVFKQKFVENSFHKSITDAISYEINCDTCNSIIYPERWTDDIERMFRYQRKAFTPRPTSRAFKNLFWGMVITGIVLIFAGIILCAQFL
ncbi:hypothetical protein [Algibacter sp. 2305UL17-15]|uniref:hypothetical protein n=1 Tax=Algibacter sp. 2305UL17-15 TaxID=3231268 RepID=UPI003458C43A